MNLIPESQSYFGAQLPLLLTTDKTVNVDLTCVNNLIQK